MIMMIIKMVITMRTAIRSYDTCIQIWNNNKNNNNAQTLHSRPTVFLCLSDPRHRSWVATCSDFRGTILKNAPKFPRPETWLKCPAISQIKSVFINSTRPHRGHNAHLGTVCAMKQPYSDIQQWVVALNLKTSINSDKLCEEFCIIKPTLTV